MTAARLRAADGADLCLPLGVLLIVAMMIFPLPIVVLDSLLALNITFSLMLLVSAVYLAEPQKFTALPSMLLLATLFRLALNISTTRQLLGEGIAPEIVTAFGNFVVRGNFLVGGVLFAILTLVQFLVIAKGAERVAEVAARFTLDAMPGKQMAIDADIRAGIISLHEARERRRELQHESRLYGALDGAMKFVKGDAIAGLVITTVNLLAGFAVGVLQQGLSAGESAERYSLYTIGDGLVSQVPALLVAVAAGIAVTRVADADSPLMGREMFAQLSEQPQALSATSGVLVLLALVPGLPSLPFLAGAIVLGVAGRLGVATRAEQARIHTAVEFRPRGCAPLTLVVTEQAAAQLQKEQELPMLVREYRARMFSSRGVLVPDPELEVRRPAVGEAIGSEDREAIPTVAIVLRGCEVARVDGSRSAAGSTGGSLSRHTAEAIASAVEQHLLELVDDTHTRLLFDLHQARCEDLLNSVVPECITVTGLTTLLRQLISEGVSVANLSGILQAVAEWQHASRGGADSRSAAAEPPTQSSELLSVVRIALRRSILADLCPGSGALCAWVLELETDHLLANAAALNLPLAPESVERLIAAAKELLEADGTWPLVIVCSARARRLLFTLLTEELGQVRVLAVEELGSVPLNALGELSLAGHRPATRGGLPDDGIAEEGIAEDEPFRQAADMRDGVNSSPMPERAAA